MRLETLPGLLTLRCFESAARHKSYTAAAEEMRLTQSAVSKKIKALEAETGMKLFRRIGRGVVLTSAGQTLADNLRVNLLHIQKSVNQAKAAAEGKTLVSIATLPTFANLWLIPKIPAFFKINPEVELHISTRLEPFDFEEEPFDLAIHYGLEVWPNTRITHLFGESMTAVCAPEFFERHQLSDMSNLIQAPLLHLKSRPLAWEDWLRISGLEFTISHNGMRLDQYSMVISAALAGLGAAVVPSSMVVRELAAESLVQLNDAPLVTEKSYFLVRPNWPRSKAVQTLERWIFKQARNTQLIGMK